MSGQERTEVLRQIKLGSNGRELVAWLDDRRHLKVGDAVTLKNHPEPDRLWTVLEIYGAKQRAEIRTDWRVGGLT